MANYFSKNDFLWRIEEWSLRRESNPRPLPYQGSALPLSHASHALCVFLNEKRRFWQINAGQFLTFSGGIDRIGSMNFHVIKTLKTALIVLLCHFSGNLRAECVLDDAGDVQGHFDHYLENEDCLEPLVDWVFSSSSSSISMDRLESLNELMTDNWGEYPREVYNLSGALEEVSYDLDGLVVETDEIAYEMVSGGLLNAGVANGLAAAAAAGGGYYVAEKSLQRIPWVDRLTLQFRNIPKPDMTKSWLRRLPLKFLRVIKVNPLTFLVGMAAGFGAAEVAMDSVGDAFYQSYLENRLEKNIWLLKQDLRRLDRDFFSRQFSKEKRGRFFKKIVKIAIDIETVERKDFFNEFNEGLESMEQMNFDEIREFFAGLVERHPMFLDEDVKNGRISSLLVTLEALILTEQEAETLHPLREYLVLMDNIRNLSRWYTKD